MAYDVEKPAGSTWTDEQWEAIWRHGEDVLVAAAAGSGKTAVLIERIIRKVSIGDTPLDVDRLLVATFTKAAAAEMKQRIRIALEAALEHNPSSEHLRRQLALIHRASITTLHSFCMEVVKRHASQLDLDPGFRIANETEVELIRQDVLESLFEDRYAAESSESSFWNLLEAYGGDRSDIALYDLVQRIYDFSLSHPWPTYWLEQQLQAFEPDGMNMGAWYDELRQELKMELEGVLIALLEAYGVAVSPGGPYPYAEMLDHEATLVESAIASAEHALQEERDSAEDMWDHMKKALDSIHFDRLKPCRGDEIDKTLQERAKALRDTAKKKITTIKEELFFRDHAAYQKELQDIQPLMAVLIDLVGDFSTRFQAAKRDKNLLDFSDLEHACLAVLLDGQSEPGVLTPSEVALAYREQFAEVLLDEYQDTNRVQEAILTLISRPEPGNRFMVGDVKQSIYRFRLAEPELFMTKYRLYEHSDSGRRIDLARNFRSRSDVLGGINFLFRQMMREAVMEIEYDSKAELYPGAQYPEMPSHLPGSGGTELILIDRHDAEASEGGEQQEADSWEDPSELAAVQLEARSMASRIRLLLGMDGNPPHQVYDRKIGSFRPVQYRDMVILFRATQSWAPIVAEEFKALGIPCYAEFNSGYFAAIEIEMMMALLQVIDNPLQDIPLAAVLRSPVVGLSADEMAQIRLSERHASYLESVQHYISQEMGTRPYLQQRLKTFLDLLERWREEARQGALSELIWSIYDETGLYDMVGGMPGGPQRQANLNALYDRARQYEKTSFRGLFRFLRFINRLRDRGGDLGTARALGEQEDVVRIMSIHKSKGLEFPIVFVAGLGKLFNRQDFARPFLLHKELGFGPKWVDEELRISYPTLPFLSIRRRLRREMLAEELRILYVALTRAEEKLYLIGSVKDLTKKLLGWSETVRSLQASDALPDHAMLAANTPLDWIVPALLRHPQAEALRQEAGLLPDEISILPDDSPWRFEQLTLQDDAFQLAAAGKVGPTAEERGRVQRLESVWEEISSARDEILRRLNWMNPWKRASEVVSKTSVSELKRQQDQLKLTWEDEEPRIEPMPNKSRKPRFLEERQMTAAERGTIYHTVMQHVPLKKDGLSEADLEEVLSDLVLKHILTDKQAALVDSEIVLGFFESSIGQRMLNAEKVYRELPFNYGMPAHEAVEMVDSVDALQGETVMIQGVIDCLFKEEDGWVLVDYKTDRVGNPNRIDEIKQRYQLQIEWYSRAIEDIWKAPVKEKILYLFDGPYLADMDGDEIT